VRSPALAVAAVAALNRVLNGFELALSPWLLIASLAAALTIATLSGLYPAWRASKVDVVEALTFE